MPRQDKSLVAIVVALACGGASPFPTYGSDMDAILDFFAGQGCAIGPATRRAAIAAGWYEGMSMTQKGTPRPPLCHYE